MNSDVRLFYITCPTQEVSQSIATTLLKEGLIACANILPHMESLYSWEDKITSTQEAVLILKSTKDLADRVMSRVSSMHPYNTPCILVLPVEKGHEAYIKWLKGSLN